MPTNAALPGLAGSALAALAHQIHRVVHRAHPCAEPRFGSRPAQVIRLRARREAGLRALPEGGHPVEHLTGLEAPSDWWGVGLATTGTAHHLDSDAGTTRASGQRRVALVVLVARRGASASAVGFGSEPPQVEADPDGREPQGHLLDGCRRVLGLATEPPPGGTEHLAARQWLDAVMAAATRAGPTLRWSQVAALHPHVGGSGPIEVPQLVALGHRLGPAVGWDRLRAAVAAGPDQGPGSVRPRQAAWMDDGMFARALLGGYPDPEELVAHLAALVTEPALAGVRAALSAWGVVPGESS